MFTTWKPRHLACKVTIEFNKDRNIGHQVSPFSKNKPKKPTNRLTKLTKHHTRWQSFGSRFRSEGSKLKGGKMGWEDARRSQDEKSNIGIKE